MAPNRIVVHNSSASSAVDAQLRSLFNGELLAEESLAPKKNWLLPIPAGAAVLRVADNGTGAVLWSGAVPADSGAPIVVAPEQRSATYRGRALPRTPIVEGFRLLAHREAEVYPASRARLALWAAAVAAVIAFLVWALRPAQQT